MTDRPACFRTAEVDGRWAVVSMDGQPIGYFGRGEEGRLSAKAHLATMLNAPVTFCTSPEDEPGLTVCGVFLP